MQKKNLASDHMDFKLVNGKMSYIYCCLWSCPSEECQEWFRSTVVFSSVGFHLRQFGCIELISQTGFPLRCQARSGQNLQFTAVNQLVTL